MPILCKDIRAANITNAERFIIKHVRSCEFSVEKSALTMGNGTPKASKIRRLEPFIDGDGILRVGGRLRAAPISDSAKHPAIIQKQHCVALLIARYYHVKEAKRCGGEYVLAALKQTFWTPSPRTLISKVITQCILCRTLGANPCSQRTGS